MAHGAGKTILIVSDWHCGHRVGLTAPKHWPKLPADAPRHLRKESDLRRTLWKWFIKEVRAVGAIDRVIENGDAIEGKGDKSGGTELLTSDRGEQVDMAADIFEAIGCPAIYMTFGTPYHAGKEEDWESVLAKHDKVKAKKIEGEGHYDVNGLKVAAKHYIGNSSSPVSSATAMTAAHIKQLLWAEYGQQPHANLIIRSHIHRCYGVSEPGLNWQGWVTPGLQGLGSKYGIRQRDSLPVQFGFLVLRVKSKTDWWVQAVCAPLVLQHCGETRL